MAAMRLQILKAARTVFEEHGVSASSMSDVAAQAGLSVGSIYVHFKSKDEVLKQLIETAGMTNDPFAQSFAECTDARALLRSVETILRREAKLGAATQAARTALEVAAITRRNADVQQAVARNFAHLRQALMGAVERVGSANPLVEKGDIQGIGEALLSLLVAAQAQTLIGVPTSLDAKLKAARVLVATLHGAAVSSRR
jgi:AcrR family transcriptional regulator